MKRNILKGIITFLFLIESYILIDAIHDLNILPKKYLLLFIAIIGMLNLIGFTGLIIKKTWTKFVSAFFYIILAIICLIGVISGNKLEEFLNKSFGNAESKYTSEYYIISKNEYDESYINGKNISYITTDSNNLKVIEILTTNFKATLNGTDDFDVLFNSDLFVIERATFDALIESDSQLNKDDFHVIYKFTLDIELNNTAVGQDENVDVEENRTAGEVYNIFVGGYDFTNTFMDFNLLITINKTNKEVLLTSIPRDYYITDAKVGKKDKLSDMGSRGIETNMASIANLFGIKIDYYVKVNTKSLITMVNAVGGINYCSNQAYTTSHAMVIDTYDDSKGEKLYVKKGCQSLNGIQALTVARERLAFTSGDIQRQKNCVQILKAILSRISVSNYTKVLNAVSGAYSTTMPKEFVTSNAKSYFEDTKWNIKSQTLTGSHGNNYIFFSTRTDYVMYPNQGSVNTAKDRIQKMKYYKLSELGM